MWVFSLSFVHQWVQGTPWRFIDPTIVYGASAWRKHGEEAFRQASTFDLVRLQIELVSRQTVEIIEALTFHGPQMFSHWLTRMHFLPAHAMLLNVEPLRGAKVSTACA